MNTEEMLKLRKEMMDPDWAKPIFNKMCSICEIPFTTTYKNKNICSFACKKEHNRRNSRFYARSKRNGKKKECLPCEVCGFSETTDQHYESGKVYTLCPNHHALITRNIQTLQQVMSEMGV